MDAAVEAHLDDPDNPAHDAAMEAITQRLCELDDKIRWANPTNAAELLGKLKITAAAQLEEIETTDYLNNDQREELADLPSPALSHCYLRPHDHRRIACSMRWIAQL